jgi:hypothetical protein
VPGMGVVRTWSWRGEVPEHPAWEDVILWEELSRPTEALRALVRRLEAGGSVGS